MTDLERICNSVKKDIFALYDGLDISEKEREEMELNGEPVSLYDYFSDVLDIEYHIGGSGDFRGVRLAVTLGGPNVYVDTSRGEVVGYWGTETVSEWIPSEICDEIDFIFEEIYNCMK